VLGFYLVDLLSALGAAVLVGLVVAVGFRRGTGWRELLWLFLLLFLGTWAIGGWMVPFGPSLGDWRPLPYLAVAVAIGAVLSAALPRRPRRATLELARNVPPEKASVAALVVGMAFWIALFVFVLGLGARYLLQHVG